MTSKKRKESEAEMEDGKRISRNQVEKLRRDRLTSSVNELGQLLPAVVSADRKVDKLTILRHAANNLRFYQDFVKKKLLVQEPNLKYLRLLSSTLLESNRGFLFVLNKDGTLVFATELLTEQLGHDLLDVIGMPFYNLVHPDDQDVLPDIFDKYTKGQRTDRACSCYLRIASIVTFQEDHFECVYIKGFLKTVLQEKPAFLAHEEERTRDETYLVAVGRVVTRESLCEITSLPEDQSTDVWVTQTSLDGHVLHITQNYAMITGRLSSEDQDLSSYDIIHKDDIPMCAVQHVSALKSGPKDPLGMYLRYHTKNGQLIYTYCTTHMVANLWTNKLKYIVTVHHVINHNEGKKKIAEQMEMMAVRASELAALAATASSDSDSLDSEKTEDSLSVENTEGDVNFLPELMDMMQLTKETKPQEKEQKVAKFKKASEPYKKQIGILVTNKRMCNTSGNNSDALVQEQGDARKRKTPSERERESSLPPEKFPLLHSLLADGSPEKQGSESSKVCDTDEDQEGVVVKQEVDDLDDTDSEIREELQSTEALLRRLEAEVKQRISSGGNNRACSCDCSPEEETWDQREQQQLQESLSVDTSLTNSVPVRVFRAGADLIHVKEEDEKEGGKMQDSTQADTEYSVQIYLARQLRDMLDRLQVKLRREVRELQELLEKATLIGSLRNPDAAQLKQNILRLKSQVRDHERLLSELKQDYERLASALVTSRRQGGAGPGSVPQESGSEGSIISSSSSSSSNHTSNSEGPGSWLSASSDSSRMVVVSDSEVVQQQPRSLSDLCVSGPRPGPVSISQQQQQLFRPFAADELCPTPSPMSAPSLQSSYSPCSSGSTASCDQSDHSRSPVYASSGVETSRSPMSHRAQVSQSSFGLTSFSSAVTPPSSSFLSPYGVHPSTTSSYPHDHMEPPTAFSSYSATTSPQSARLFSSQQQQQVLPPQTATALPHHYHSPTPTANGVSYSGRDNSLCHNGSVNTCSASLSHSHNAGVNLNVFVSQHHPLGNVGTVMDSLAYGSEFPYSKTKPTSCSRRGPPPTATVTSDPDWIASICDEDIFKPFPFQDESHNNSFQPSSGS